MNKKKVIVYQNEKNYQFNLIEDITQIEKPWERNQIESLTNVGKDQY